MLSHIVSIFLFCSSNSKQNCIWSSKVWILSTSHVSHSKGANDYNSHWQQKNEFSKQNFAYSGHAAATLMYAHERTRMWITQFKGNRFHSDHVSVRMEFNFSSSLSLSPTSSTNSNHSIMLMQLQLAINNYLFFCLFFHIKRQCKYIFAVHWEEKNMEYPLWSVINIVRTSTRVV